MNFGFGGPRVSTQDIEAKLLAHLRQLRKEGTRASHDRADALVKELPWPWPDDLKSQKAYEDEHGKFTSSAEEKTVEPMDTSGGKSRKSRKSRKSKKSRKSRKSKKSKKSKKRRR